MHDFPLCLLPGLWVAVLGILLARALQRWFDPMPWRCWAVWSAAILVLFGAVLFGGRVLLPLGYLTRVPPFRQLWPEGTPPGNLLQSDMVLQITPWLVQVREAFMAGEWPLWNHLAGAGEPLIGNPQTQVLQPLVWPALLFPVAAGIGVTAALRVLTAFAFSFLLLRRQGISEAPALGASLAWGLGGGLMLWLNWPMANSPALLPLLLYAVVLVDQRGARRDQVLLAFATFAVLCAGHPETILHVSLLASAFALSRLAARPAGERRKLLAAWSVSAAIGAGLAAPALLPAAFYLPESLRVPLLEVRRERIAREDPLAGWRDPEESVRTLSERLLPVAAPNAFGSSRFGAYWGESNSNEDAAAFVGSAALLAALLAFFPSRGRFPQERVMTGFALVALIVVVRPPGLAQAFTAVPVLRDSFTLHHRLVLTLGFCLVYLAACTWERWRRGDLSRLRIGLGAVVLGALVIWAYLAHPGPGSPPALAGLRASWLALQIGAIAVSAILMLLTRRGWLLAACVGFELLVLHAPLNPPVTARLFYPEVPPVRFIRERLEPWHRMAGLGPALRANIPSVYGLADPRTSNPAKPAGFAYAIFRINRFPYRATDGFVAPLDPLYPFLGTRFLMTEPGTKLPRPWRLAFQDRSARVWEHPRSLPRLFLPHATFPCSTGASWNDCTRRIGNFRRRAALLPGGETWAATRRRGSRLGLREVGPAWIRGRVDLAETRLLASSLYQDGGWRLLLKGEPVPTIPANGPFVAAWLPRGRGPVELVYRPQGFVPGMVIAALTLTLAAVLWVRAPAPGPRP